MSFTEEEVRIYDNQGESYDRYTVVYPKDKYGSYWIRSMSESPANPLGFGIAEEYSYPIDIPDSSHLGEKIKFEELPEECQKVVLKDLDQEEDNSPGMG